MVQRALLIGINAYPPPNALQGCVNDVTDIANFLVNKCGYARGEITLLTDGRATSQNIKTSIVTLINGAQPGDRLYLHYSGHGTQMTIRTPQGTTIHDAICPVNFDWSVQNAVLDTDFQAMFSSLPVGVEFVFVSDSCHSGDLTRDIIPQSAHLKARYMEPPMDVQWNIDGAKDMGIEPVGLKAATVVHDNCGFISGCMSSQTSADAVFNNRPNGACTYYLLAELQKPVGLTESLVSLVANMNTMLAQARYSQRPQLHGPDNIINFGFLMAKPVPTKTSIVVPTKTPVPTPTLSKTASPTPSPTRIVVTSTPKATTPPSTLPPTPTPSKPRAVVVGKSGIVNPTVIKR